MTKLLAVDCVTRARMRVDGRTARPQAGIRGFATMRRLMLIAKRRSVRTAAPRVRWHHGLFLFTLNICAFSRIADAPRATGARPRDKPNQLAIMRMLGALIEIPNDTAQ